MWYIRKEYSVAIKMKKLGLLVITVINFESIMLSYKEEWSIQGGEILKYTSFENYIYKLFTHTHTHDDIFLVYPYFLNFF